MSMSVQLVPAKNGIPAHVPIGASPAGVTWNVYPKDGENLESLVSRVAFQQERLRAMWTRYNAKNPSGSSPTDIVYVRKLTENGVCFIEDHASLVEEGIEQDYHEAKFGKSYVKTTRRLLEAVESRLLDDVDNYGELARCGSAISEEQQDFAERSARRSILIVIRRIRIALEGDTQPKKVHIANHFLAL